MRYVCEKSTSYMKMANNCKSIASHAPPPLPLATALSFSCLYNVAAFCQCQCHSSCLRTWSIRRRKLLLRRKFLLISLIKFRYFSFLRSALLIWLDSKPAVNSRTFRHLDWIRKRRSAGPSCLKGG